MLDTTITEGEWKDWAQDATTKRILNLCRLEIDNQSRLLINGNTLNLQSAEATALQTARQFGVIKGMTILLETLEGSDGK